MKNRKLLSVLSLIVLLAITALSVISCTKAETPEDTNTDTVVDSAADTTASSESAKAVEITVYVTDDKGETAEYVITTEATTLRGALEQENLIQGDESEYGLYVKTVNGVTADYDTDGAYWAFYDGNDQYLMTSVDGTSIADKDVFKIIYTKG